MSYAATADDDQAFAQALAAERDAIARFIELLELEQVALRRGNTEDLLELAKNKEALATRLESLGDERQSFLAAQGVSADRKGVALWCDRHPEAKEAADAWQAILELATRARELHRVNGELIEIHLHYNSKALEALQGGRKSLDLYGPDGISKTASNQSIDHRA